MIYTDSNEIALICSECSNVEYSNVSVSVDLDNQSVEPLGFEAKIIARCPKCGSLMNECGVDIANIIQTLQKKHYYVVDSNMCRWQPGELYAPYIKILSGGPVKILPPRGWEDVTGDNIGSFQVFSPKGSYGCAGDDANPANYAIDVVFKTEEDFNNRKSHYMRKLDQWANELEMNTTIATKSNMRGASGAIDIG